MTMKKERKRRFTDVNKWNNKGFRSLKPDEKLLFMWLCDKCDMAGCLEWDSEGAEFETKLTNVEHTLLSLLEHNASIERNGDWVWLINHLEVQGNLHVSPKNNIYKPIYEAISRNSERFNGLAIILADMISPFEAPSDDLLRENSKSNGNSKSKGDGNSNSKDSVNSCEQLSENVRNVSTSIVTSTSPSKEAYGEFKNVKLTADEYTKLADRQGEKRLGKGIEILDDYIEAKGKKYKSHYATLKENSWVWERVDKDNPVQKPRYDATSVLG